MYSSLSKAGQIGKNGLSHKICIINEDKVYRSKKVYRCWKSVKIKCCKYSINWAESVERKTKVLGFQTLVETAKRDTSRLSLGR